MSEVCLKTWYTLKVFFKIWRERSFHFQLQRRKEFPSWSRLLHCNLNDTSLAQQEFMVCLLLFRPNYSIKCCLSIEIHNHKMDKERTEKTHWTWRVFKRLSNFNLSEIRLQTLCLNIQSWYSIHAKLGICTMWCYDPSH